MKPKLPDQLIEKLRASGHPPAWKCKLQLRHGRTVFAVEINAAGEIVSIGGRTIYSASDISFGPAIIENVTLS